MARSQYIYIVFLESSDGMRQVLGAFTVKHEMERFVKGYTERTVYVRRYRDANPGTGSTEQPLPA